MKPEELSPQPEPRAMRGATPPAISQPEPIINRAACIAWLRIDCARDHRPAERRGPIPDRRGPLPDRRQTTAHND